MQHVILKTGQKGQGIEKKHKQERKPESNHHWGAEMRNEINQKMK
jgi:hypothetical protein